jgi:amino acid adenylation domain-containing protein/thioester reductase-like protein
MAFDRSLVRAAKLAVHQLIEQQAARCPEAVAIEFEQQQMTYGELNRRANQLAHHLQSVGVGPGRLVSLCVERSLDMFVALLAVLKSGGTYIPLDPAYPSDRLEFMMEDSQSAVLLTHRHLAEQLYTTPALQRVDLDRDAETIAQYSDVNLNVELSADDRAYIIYTSGSTGKPKGVQIKHGALVNLLQSMQREPGMCESDTLLAMTTISFDLAVPDLYLPLIAGAKIRLVSRAVATNPAELSAVLSEPEITFVQATPATWRMVLAAGWKGNPNLKILCGGEALNRALANQLIDRVQSLWHMYGPTETTVWSMVHQVMPGNDVVPLGRPIANTQIYLLENQARRVEDPLMMVPVGVAGELYIGGDGVALGYLNRDELNEDRFIPDTFSGEPGAYLYKTGDLARYRPDGNLEFIGRGDNQVKIRGYRVELGDVETAIAQHSSVRETVVLAKEDGAGNKRLVAYVVARSEADQLDNLSEAYGDQIEQWENVWSNAYAQSTEADPTFNSNGWNDSFTGKPMPEDEVQIWVDQTVDRILDLKPKRILEIGCGMGLLLFRIAPDCEAYVGTDISAEGIQNIQRQLDQDPEKWSHVQVAKTAAHELDAFEPGSFDMVIINTVIQYFPSVNYLVDVLKQLSEIVIPGGHIFVGDVRNLDLLETFHTGVQFGFAPDSLSTEALRVRVQQKIEQEQELVIRPDFFEALKQQLPSITHIDTQLKRGHAFNELIRFRSDVTICINQPVSTLQELPVRAWSDTSLAEIYQMMSEGAIDCLKITDVPDPRIATEVQITAWLTDNDENMTVRDLREATSPAIQYAHPEDFWQLGDEMGYRINVIWPESQIPGCYDVVIQHGQKALAIAPQSSVSEPRPWHTYANNPFKSNRLNSFVPQLRSFLTETLPAHMMPSHFVVMDILPLTPNGKIDRRALPEPKKDRPTLVSDYVAPATHLEAQLASVWSQTLGFDCVGIRDNFFELGGHSLMAASLLQAVETVVEMEIPLFYLLREPTIEGLVKAINSLQKNSGETLDAAPQINWELETQLDPTIVPQGKFTFTDTPKAVLITGVSGFLGAFLLQELLQTTTAEIYCLVRADNIAEGSYKIQANLERYQILNGPLPSRVIPLLGDLAQPKLGLTEETFQGLALTLDAIYHSGAFINLVYPYSAMRATNVLGTQELLRLACQGKVTPMHFISTVDMFQSPRYFAMEQILEDTALADPDQLAIGYPQTKWVAEHLVMAARDRGLPVAIYRPGMLTGHSQTGAAQTGDLLCRIIKGLIQMEVAPEMNAWLNMIPVDYASRAIVHLSKQASTFGQCFHVVNPVAIPWNYLLHEIRMAGYPIQSIAPADWKSLLIDWPNHWENALMPMRGLFTEVIPESGMTYLEAFLHTANAFDCQNILTGLEGSGIDCPTVDARLMRTYFNAFQRSGFLPASQIDQRQQIVRKSAIQAIPSIADPETALPLPV